MTQGCPAARAPVIGVDENCKAEGEPDQQHVGARNVAQEPAAMCRLTRGHGAQLRSARRKSLFGEPRERNSSIVNTSFNGRGTAPRLGRLLREAGYAA